MKRNSFAAIEQKIHNDVEKYVFDFENRAPFSGGNGRHREYIYESF